MSGILLDKAQGGMWAFFVGDALGTPCEFGRGRMMKRWTGSFHPTWRLRRIGRFGHMTSCPVGQVSDDSEMFACLLGSLATKKGRYDLETAKENYVAWGSSGCPFMGRNTRALFRGYKRVKTYTTRYEKQFPSEESKEAARPNGALMRCWPLALLPSRALMEEATLQDTSLSNPNDLSVQASLIYLDILYDLVRGEKVDGRERVQSHIERLEGNDYLKDLKVALQDALQPEFKRVITSQGGWVCHALSISLFHLVRGSSIEDALRHIIETGGDTDTNGAICCGLLGARYGLAVLEGDAWCRTAIETVSECVQGVYSGPPVEDGEEVFVSRPEIFTPGYCAKALEIVVRTNG